MPTLILPPRLTPDTEAMHTAALAAGWDTTRLASWRVPPDLAPRDPVLYVEVPPACVLDVGVIAGRGWAVVEANSVWGAGLYGCDPSTVLVALRRACAPTEAVTAADAPWVRPLPELEDEAAPQFEHSAEGNVVLYRPVGERELALIAQSGYAAFPPRLPQQPIFYPVLNQAYATQIAREWNAREGRRGFVTRFEVQVEVAARYPVQIVGARGHAELWVPAEELEAFNGAIVGPIAVVATYSEAEGD